MYGSSFDDGYLNVPYGMRCVLGWKSRDDPGGNGGCDFGVTDCT